MLDHIRSVPKVTGGPLRVLLIGRSATPYQDRESIDAANRDAYEFLARIFDGPLHVKELVGSGSGIRTDRESIVEAESEIATGTWDLVIAIDLTRIYRNPRHLFAFIQDAIDHDTRVITVADHFDTAEPSGHTGLVTASIQHGMAILETLRQARSNP